MTRERPAFALILPSSSVSSVASTEPVPPKGFGATGCGGPEMVRSKPMRLFGSRKSKPPIVYGDGCKHVTTIANKTK